MSEANLDATFSALADPTRRAILARLAGETSVTELAKPFRMPAPPFTEHLKVLEKAGLIERGREAQTGRLGSIRRRSRTRQIGSKSIAILGTEL